MLARTQIGGKYDQAEQSLFDLRQRLLDADVDVVHPASGGIVATVNGRGYTFDPNNNSFFDVETDYYRSIATSDFHTVNNRFLSHLGYIGASAALEIAYAMLHNRPILLMHPPVLAPSVDPVCADIIHDHSNLLHVHDMSTMALGEIATIATEIRDQTVDYAICEQVGHLIMERVGQMFKDIQSDE